jgi:hypothetical protein
MTRRKDVAFPRVTREVLSFGELYTTDLETMRTVKKMVWCEFHQRWEWIADFYLESKPRAKHPYDVRNMCIEGWDITEGKISNGPTIRRLKPEPSATLMQFIEEQND